MAEEGVLRVFVYFLDQEVLDFAGQGDFDGQFDQVLHLVKLVVLHHMSLDNRSGNQKLNPLLI